MSLDLARQASMHAIGIGGAKVCAAGPGPAPASLSGLTLVTAPALGWRGTKPRRPTMMKLNDSQTAILANATSRADGQLLPLPEGIQVKGGALTAKRC